MKKILMLIFLVFILASCWSKENAESKELETNNLENQEISNQDENIIEDENTPEKREQNKEKYLSIKDKILNNNKNTDTTSSLENTKEIFQDFWNWLSLKTDWETKYIYFNDEIIKTITNEWVELEIIDNKWNSDLLVLWLSSNSIYWSFIILDKTNNNLYQSEAAWWWIMDIKIWDNWLYILKSYQNWQYQLELITNNWKSINIFSLEQNQDSSNLLNIINSFELLEDNKIKINYTIEYNPEILESWTKKEEIIDLNTFDL